ncbi:hypothetical protein LTR37_009279 [Vermiconidia calcicola]|uniref:Uncharacterized protein n=1 Tax=Vermiconidia calcicola TaxID=1690605 RepID=A0ACC3N9N7_9PEZI|nr:hypothetical protein LTR37_009279 [Vermiconidia calcicola]
MYSYATLVSVFAFSSLGAALPAPLSNNGNGDGGSSGINVQLGPRPYFLVDDMDKGPLKRKLESCSEGPFSTSSFSISHRGAPLMFPEHSIIECDVSFTSDRELVCRHSNCDLHYTTNILAHPKLAAKCTEPFTPYDPDTGEDASAKCCTSDITLTEFQSLCAEMEATTFNALNTSQYMGRTGSTPNWRTDLYAYTCAETMALKDYIPLVDSMGLDFTAEAKTPEIKMPFQGDYTQHDFVHRLLAARGVNIVAPSTWQLLEVNNATGKIVPSSYATAAKDAGLDIITWSLERSGPLENGGGYYYTGLESVINNDGDEYTVIDVLAQQVGVSKMFSDWSATVTYYANCFGLE